MTAYAAYRAFANRRGQTIELAGCWAHARRKFHEALEASPRLAGWLLGQIQQLYRIRNCQLAGTLTPARVCEPPCRASQSRPVVKRIEPRLDQTQSQQTPVAPKPAGKDVDYALGQWRTLEVYLAEGRVEIDNNLVENAIRPTAIGKKNWLFVGEADAGQRSAIIYTVIET